MTVRKYRVREGFTYGAFSQFGPGEIVDLDEETAKHSMDKLELAEIVHNVPTMTIPETLPATDDGKKEDTPEEVSMSELGLLSVEMAEEPILAPSSRSRSTRKSGD